ncbi:hypothetical protein FBALC1_17257 [Flavobacteriales bacterium ALC-1]|nr:hypothetical protein FBALC1_00115 [Flavobacteriales bacterium ALC-1]EDP72871.1 hypothetical protein FBALC1_17257 [Flavobacteriales bacterium ALC-1]
MNNEKLQEIYASVGDSIQGKLGAWQFQVKDVTLISLTDTQHNRMRIISPIAESKDITDDLLKAAMVANFHTALDVKYAITNGVLWSVYTHPLKELSEDQVRDALSQVYKANVNFGSTFTSTALTFPAGTSTDKETVKKPKSSLKKKKA